MRHLLGIAAALLAAGCATTDQVKLIGSPDARGWQLASSGLGCFAVHGDWLLGSPDGGRLLLGVENLVIEGPREVEIDGRSLVLVFHTSGSVASAEVPLADVDQLTGGADLKAKWPERELDGPAPTMDMVSAVLACGLRAGQQRAQAEERRQRMMIVGQILSGVGSAPPPPSGSYAAAPAAAHATTACFKQAEWTSGLNKNCIYDCLGSQAVQTIDAVGLCPLTINR